MELTQINEVMAAKGYPHFVGPLFPNWEFVKDEILLPNRKTGSGNGTVHVYLLDDNMKYFEQCFADYVAAYRQNGETANSNCPKVTHFAMTSNLLTVAVFAYHHYNCDANIFNYADYVNKVMRADDDGLISFESLFKLTTADRPYFKQFDKTVFSQLVRYTFVPQKTAYKLYLYSDPDSDSYAVFWLIGQIADCPFLITDSKPQNQRAGYVIPSGEEPSEEVITVTTANEPIDEPGNDDAPTPPAAPVVQDNSPSGMRKRFMDYMRALGKSERTVSSYAGNLENLVPRVQKMIDGLDHPSPYTYTDYATLKKIDDELWANPEAYQWNRDTHNRTSAALHLYLDMLKGETPTLFTPAESKPYDKPAKAKSTQQVLSVDEEMRKAAFAEFLRDVKELAERSYKVYMATIQGKMSDMFREHYDPSIETIYGITSYKKLLDMEKALPGILEKHDQSVPYNRQLMAAFHAYIEFMESNLSDEELASMIFG